MLLLLNPKRWQYYFQSSHHVRFSNNYSESFQFNELITACIKKSVYTDGFSKRLSVLIETFPFTPVNVTALTTHTKTIEDDQLFRDNFVRPLSYLNVRTTVVSCKTISISTNIGLYHVPNLQQINTMFNYNDRILSNV